MDLRFFVPIESTYATSYLSLIVTSDIAYRDDAFSSKIACFLYRNLFDAA